MADTPEVQTPLIFGESANNTPTVDMVFGAVSGAALNPINLVFKDLPAGAGAVNLVFGSDTTAPPPSAVEITIDGALPALWGTFYSTELQLLSADAALPTLSGEFSAVAVSMMKMDGALPSLSGDFSTLYISNTQRPTVCKTQQLWQLTDKVQGATGIGFQSTKPFPSGNQSEFQDATKLQLIAKSAFQSNLSRHTTQFSRFQNGIKVGTDTTDRQQNMLRLRNPSAAKWQVGVKAGTDLHDGWQDRFRTPRPSLATKWDEANKSGIDHSNQFGIAIPAQIGRESHWQVTRKPPVGKSIWVIPPVVVPPGNPCYTPDGDLLFNDLFSTSADLLFRCQNNVAPPTATTVVPIRRTYIVLNDVQLIRVDGSLELPAIALSLNIDMDSWTWDFTADLPASALSLIEPGVSGDPVLLQAVINGASYLLLAESITRDRTFGKSTISVSGRGQSAMLAEPYSPILTFSNASDRTAQQLMADALTTNGVSIGWDIDWRIEDWLVPSGVWSHQGSYMSAVNAIAAAAGAFIQPDPVLKILRVRPRYPYKPWEWYGAGVIPDLELPTAAIVKESIAWTEKPAYNAVYVSGTTAGGILGHVKRAGTAGDMMAPMIADALITHSVAARQRGMNVLADTGRIATYSLNLPVLPETGIIDPGTLVRYVDNGNPTIGVVKGVSVSASKPSVRQTIEVLTHG
ncbi:MAG: hypothetical protein GZ090_01365 [Oxalobacteraceae bacterium]|nr:hypothetical protein [Oxalobacteraceae bacterium]